MSELNLGQIKGLPVNNNVVTVPSGHTLYAPGHVIQTVSTTKTDSFTTTSATFVDVTGLSVTITPKFTTSKILITAEGGVCQGNNANGTRVNLVRDSVAILQGTGGTYNQSSIIYSGNQYTITPVTMSTLDAPATTSAITYKVQLATDGGGTSYWGRRSPDLVFSYPSSITVQEIAA